MRDVIWFERLKPLTHCDFKGVDKPPSTEMFKTMCQGMHLWDITTKEKNDESTNNLRLSFGDSPLSKPV